MGADWGAGYTVWTLSKETLLLQSSINSVLCTRNSFILLCDSDWQTWWSNAQHRKCQYASYKHLIDSRTAWNPCTFTTSENWRLCLTIFVTFQNGKSDTHAHSTAGKVSKGDKEFWMWVPVSSSPPSSWPSSHPWRRSGGHSNMCKLTFLTGLQSNESSVLFWFWALADLQSCRVGDGSMWCLHCKLPFSRDLWYFKLLSSLMFKSRTVPMKITSGSSTVTSIYYMFPNSVSVEPQSTSVWHHRWGGGTGYSASFGDSILKTLFTSTNWAALRHRKSRFKYTFPFQWLQLWTHSYMIHTWKHTQSQS